MNITTTRVELKVELGLGTVKQITTVRKGLGHPDWQNSSMSDVDADEVRLYFTHVRSGSTVEEALTKVAQSRSLSQDFNNINPEAVDHSQRRDDEEERSEIVVATQQVTQEVSLAMTDLASEVADTATDVFCIALSNNLAANLGSISKTVRSNFRGIAREVDRTPINLLGGSLKQKKLQSGRLY